VYQSKGKIQNKNLGSLKSDLILFLSQKSFIYSKALGKKVLLSKLPDVILNRKSTQKARLECFLVAMDILRNSKECTERTNNKKEKEFEIQGLSAENKKIFVHVREEVSLHKDKQTYFVSCFYKA
jgi:hypothetical protein